MAKSFKFMGVDGCPAGWFCIELTQDNDWQIIVAEHATVIIPAASDKTRVLIDMPIGLLESGGPQRLCDQQARQLLGRPRASSVFPVPTRQAVYAASYPDAQVINRRQVGRGLSKQAWNIAPKIKQLDQVLQNSPALRTRMRESHPEVCFWALNGKRAMQFNKKQSPGFTERFVTLQHYCAATEDIVTAALAQYPRKQLARDDVLDALVLAISAKLGSNTLKTIPSQPPMDLCGMRMEIVYADPEILPQ